MGSKPILAARTLLVLAAGWAILTLCTSFVLNYTSLTGKNVEYIPTCSESGGVDCGFNLGGDNAYFNYEVGYPFRYVGFYQKKEYDGTIIPKNDSGYWDRPKDTQRQIRSTCSNQEKSYEQEIIEISSPEAFCSKTALAINSIIVGIFWAAIITICYRLKRRFK